MAAACSAPGSGKPGAGGAWGMTLCGAQREQRRWPAPGLEGGGSPRGRAAPGLSVRAEAGAGLQLAGPPRLPPHAAGRLWRRGGDLCWSLRRVCLLGESGGWLREQPAPRVRLSHAPRQAAPDLFFFCSGGGCEMHGLAAEMRGARDPGCSVLGGHRQSSASAAATATTFC